MLHCIFLQETYVLVDAIYAQINEISYTSTYTDNKDHSIIVDNNLEIDLPTNCEITFKVKSNISGSRFGIYPKSKISSTTSNYGFGISRNATNIFLHYRTTSSQYWGTTDSVDTDYHTAKFVKTGTSIEGFLDNVSKGSNTFNWITSYTDYSFAWWVWNSGTIYAKDIIVKPL